MPDAKVDDAVAALEAARKLIAQAEEQANGESKPEPEPEGQSEPKMPLAKVGDRYAVLSTPEKEVREIIKANLSGGFGTSEFDLDRIRVPMGGATSWQVPTLEGPESAESFSGIILHYKDQRSYWSEAIAESGGNMPPDCTSGNDLVGKGEPGGDCQTCPYSEWGSRGEGMRGQACRVVRMMFIVRPSDLIPLVLSVPPSSYKLVKGYFLRLASARVPFWGCVTKFGLQSARMSGFDVSQIVPVMETRLSEEEAARMQKVASDLESAFSKIQVMRDDLGDQN